MITTVKYDIPIKQGADFELELEFLNADGSPFDLTGSLITGQIKRKTSDVTPIATFTVLIPSLVNGKAYLKLSKVVTAGIPVDANALSTFKITQYVYDAFLTLPNAIAEPLLEGSANVTPRVTT